MHHYAHHKKKRAHRGFVLFTVLIFLQLFSLLGVLSLMSAILELKSTYHAWRQDKERWKSLQIMNGIESDMLNHLPPCEIAPLSTEKIVDMPNAWWQAHACSGGKHVAYVIENLGLDPCSVMMRKDSNTSQAVIFYRLTLRNAALKEKSAKIILQSTIAIPSSARATCAEVLHPVRAGRQMRRQL